MLSTCRRELSYTHAPHTRTFMGCQFELAERLQTWKCEDLNADREYYLDSK
jgi:hypothetical protein